MGKIYLRNCLTRPVWLPLPGGGRRYLRPQDTGGIPVSAHVDPGIRAAEAAGVLVRVLLPPPPGQPWRLAGAFGSMCFL